MQFGRRSVVGILAIQRVNGIDVGQRKQEETERVSVQGRNESNLSWSFLVFPEHCHVLFLSHPSPHLSLLAPTCCKFMHTTQTHSLSISNFIYLSYRVKSNHSFHIWDVNGLHFLIIRLLNIGFKSLFRPK